ncbi:unnamed protein product [Scytosiphon promiscuus]
MVAAPSFHLLVRVPIAAFLLAVAVGKGTITEVGVPVGAAEDDVALAGEGRQESRPQRLRSRPFAEGGRGSASALARDAGGSLDEDYHSVRINGGGSGGEMIGARPRLGARAIQSEANSIRARDIPFLQAGDEWQREGCGISITAKGEPKSGTTWLGRLMPQLALQLCGSSTNTWCEMGGLVVVPNEPSPWYEFEMLKKDESGGDNPTLFLHYKGNDKHLIPGMTAKDPPDGCTNGGRRHRNFFENDMPCISGYPPNREMLRSCLWDPVPQCLGFIPGDHRRTAVMFRDPRDVIISERRMRLDHYHQGWVREISIDDFVRERFENVVSWTHQRWVWHVETEMKEMSHVMFYDELQVNNVPFVPASCRSISYTHSLKQARSVSTSWLGYTVCLTIPLAIPSPQPPHQNRHECCHRNCTVVKHRWAQANYLGMIDLAAFMGLECSEEQARLVWESHQNAEPHGDYTTHGLRLDTIEWMNATMARLLPPVTAIQWGITPTDV